MMDVLAVAYERRTAVEADLRRIDQFIECCETLAADAGQTVGPKSERCDGAVSQMYADASPTGENVVYLWETVTSRQ